MVEGVSAHSLPPERHDQPKERRFNLGSAALLTAVVAFVTGIIGFLMLATGLCLPVRVCASVDTPLVIAGSAVATVSFVLNVLAFGLGLAAAITGRGRSAGTAAVVIAVISTVFALLTSLPFILG